MSIPHNSPLRKPGDADANSNPGASESVVVGDNIPQRSPFNLMVACTRCNQEVGLLGAEPRLPTELRCPQCKSTIARFVYGAGWVYVLTHPAMPNLVKIGMTTRSVAERLLELSSATGVPGPFRCEGSFVSIRPEYDEQRVHNALKSLRVSGTEFFRVELPEALELCRQICADFREWEVIGEPDGPRTVIRT